MRPAQRARRCLRGNWLNAAAVECTRLGAGLLVDAFWRPGTEDPREGGHALCEHCRCEERGILPAALRHTAGVFLFILLVNFLLGGAVELLGEEQFVRMVRAFGADRVLFGTDSPWDGQAEALARLRALPLEGEELDAILGGNALRLLWGKEA